MKIHTHFNVASLTDNGTGDFSLTYSIPFASASSYAVIVAPSLVTSPSIGAHIDHSNPPTANSCRILLMNNLASGHLDNDPVGVVAIGRR